MAEILSHLIKEYVNNKMFLVQLKCVYNAYTEH